MRQFLLIILILGGISMSAMEAEGAAGGSAPKAEYNKAIAFGKAKIPQIFADLQNNLFWDEKTREILFITTNAKENYFDVFEDFRLAIDLDPQKAEAYFCAGVALALARDAAVALEYLDKAIELDAKYAEAYLVRGAVKNVLCDYQGAKDDLTSAADLGLEVAKEFAEKISVDGTILL